MSYQRKANPRPESDIEEQYCFLLWQKSEAQEDIRFLKYQIQVREEALEMIENQLKETYKIAKGKNPNF